MIAHSLSLFAMQLGGALVALGIALAPISMASAQSRPAFDKPIYSPDTKSYFELVLVKPEEAKLSVRGAPEIRWEIAASLASKRIFKGVKGRLAVVRNLKVHQFLMEKFRPQYPAWIGAAYHCKARQLRWSDGHIQGKNDFRAWHPQWDQAGGASCMQGRGERDYMPIAYTGVGEGFRWVAKGGIKEYTYYFVEYPTGKE